MPSCPFCNAMSDVVLENEHAFSIRDRHPVSPGHSLIIPKKHAITVFALPVEDYRGCLTWSELFEITWKENIAQTASILV